MARNSLSDMLMSHPSQAYDIAMHQAQAQRQAMSLPASILGGELAGAQAQRVDPNEFIQYKDRGASHEIAYIDQMDWQKYHKHYEAGGWKVLENIIHQRTFIIGRGNIPLPPKIEGGWHEPEPKTIREKLQKKTDEWLGEVKKKLTRR